MKRLLYLLLLPAVQALALDKEVELKTTITGVTVFQAGAQVTRVGSVTLPVGEYDVVVRDATSLLKKESIIVRSDGDFTILSVNHQQNLDNEFTDWKKIEELDAKEKTLLQQMQDLSVKIEVLRSEEAVVSNLESVSTTTEGVSVEQVTKAQDLLQQKLSRIKNDKLIACREMEDLYEKHRQVVQELNVMRTPKKSVSYEIVIRVSVKTETKANFDITYIVPNAHWYPTYDLRVKTVNDPMTIEYKANVSQQTGEDWSNVKLVLSTGYPSKTSQKPKVETWLLRLNEPSQPPVQQNNFYRYTDAQFNKVQGLVLDRKTGEPVPFCLVSVPGTSIAASTDMNGHYSLVLPEGVGQLKFALVGYEPQTIGITGEEMNVYLEENGSSLEEVTIINGGSIDEDLKTVNGMGGDPQFTQFPTVTRIPNLVNTEFTINEKYNIVSGPKTITVSVQTIQTNAKYQYYCAPRLDKDVFLTAQVTDWEQYNLIEGQANVFFEGTFIGNTLLDTRYLSDTLEVSLGRDKSVKVERVKSKEYNKRQVLGSDNIAYREWDITARNGKAQAINIIIEDQFPLSSDSKIDVKEGTY